MYFDVYQSKDAKNCYFNFRSCKEALTFYGSYMRTLVWIPLKAYAIAKKFCIIYVDWRIFYGLQVKISAFQEDSISSEN